MEGMRIIPTRVHAAADYTVGLLLLVAPWLFGFADDSSAAQWISVLAGVAIIAMSTITDYEAGFLARIIPMQMHLAADAVLGLFLAASPWLFGFADQGAHAWLPFLLIGIGEIGAAALTEPAPGATRTHRPASGRA